MAPEGSEQTASQRSAKSSAGLFVRLGSALADWSERWFPDALVFALVAIVIVFAALSLSWLFSPQ